MLQRLLSYAVLGLLVVGNIPMEFGPVQPARAEPPAPQCSGEFDENCWHLVLGTYYILCPTYINTGPFHTPGSYCYHTDVQGGAPGP